MNEKTANALKQFAVRIEESSAKIVATQGYNDDAALLKIIEELLKEQVVHENTGDSTCSIR